MAKNDQQEAFEKLMSANHARMIEFTRFAETKNAALLTFCSVWMGALITLINSPLDFPMNYRYAFGSAIIPLFIAALICLRSIFPKFFEQIHTQDTDEKNLLYFAHIADVGASQYIEMSNDRYMPIQNDSFSEKYIHDLAVQTTIHAKIALRKFRMFNLAGNFVLTAFLIMTIPPLLYSMSWVARNILFYFQRFIEISPN